MSGFTACRTEVHNRGRAPTPFLEELVLWGRGAAEGIFAENARADIYASVLADLGPWEGLPHRKAVMLEVLRVLGGFESSWDWNAGRDTTNEKSNTPCTEEAGIFQCSGDSIALSPSLGDLLFGYTGKRDCDTFRIESKSNHSFAIEYCARLLRFTTKHHGPVRDRHIHKWLRRDAVAEFQRHLA